MFEDDVYLVDRVQRVYHEAEMKYGLGHVVYAIIQTVQAHHHRNETFVNNEEYENPVMNIVTA